MPGLTLATPSLCLTFLRLLEHLLPSRPTVVENMDVPPLFREQYILSGYRQVGLSWRCYTQSLFQIHNQTVNIWSHLLAAVCVVMRFMIFSILQGGGILGFRLQGLEDEGFSVDVSSLPLVLYVFSTITFLSCSFAAHLLHPCSERTYYMLFFLDSMSMALYQYSCAMAQYLYSSGSAGEQSLFGQIFLLVSAFLSWISCTTYCYLKIYFNPAYLPRRKLCHVIPLGLANLMVIVPVVHRLTIYTWRKNSTLFLHFMQVVLFLLSAFFSMCPVPELICPGSYDILGHSHQLSHVLSALCMIVQQEALFQDFQWRRSALVRVFGEDCLVLACVLFLCLMLCCAVTAFTIMRRRRRRKGQSCPVW